MPTQDRIECLLLHHRPMQLVLNLEPTVDHMHVEGFGLHVQPQYLLAYSSLFKVLLEKHTQDGEMESCVNRLYIHVHRTVGLSCVKIVIYPTHKLRLVCVLASLLLLLEK